MLSSPKRRALSHRSMLRPVAIDLAMRFHNSGELSTQNFATSVWSAVRALPVDPPIRLTSLKSSAYRLLVNGYGGPLANWVLSRSTNGVTDPHFCANANGVPGVNLY